MQNKIAFCILSPGGNDTAIVESPVARDCQPEVAKHILRQWQKVEQVLFLEQNNGKARGQMMGGEFCVNAARALGFYLLDGKYGDTCFDFSGYQGEMRVKVDKSGAHLSLGLNKNPNNITLHTPGIYKVKLDGITHYIVLPQAGLFAMLRGVNDSLQKSLAGNWILEHTDTSDPATGLILTEWITQDNAKILPYIYVQGTGSLYAETACGSGSLAAAMVKAQPARESFVRHTIVQPSGRSLIVHLQRQGSNFIAAEIGGSVQYIGRYCISILNDKVDQALIL